MKRITDFLLKFLQCFFCWKVCPSSDFEEGVVKADAIIGLAFGLRVGRFDAKWNFGKSNIAIARIIRKIHNQYCLPLILSKEIADCIPGLRKAHVVENHRIEGKYLDTYEALCQQREFCQDKGWHRVVLVAHPDHYWRCMMVAKRLGFEVIAVNTSSVPYDELSTQFWTTSGWVFIPREILARLFYLLTGKI